MQHHSKQRDSERGGCHEDQHAGRVRAALRLHVCLENYRDEESNGGEQNDQRTRSLGPFRGHAVARQVARYKVQQTGHR